VYTDESRAAELLRFHGLRQQWDREGQTCFRSLADYIAPRSTGLPDYLGAFAVTTGHGCDDLVRRFESQHDDYGAIMTKALADRFRQRPVLQSPASELLCRRSDHARPGGVVRRTQEHADCRGRTLAGAESGL